MAPEIFNGDRYDEKVDTWAMGVLLYFMMTQEYPFEGSNWEQIKEKVLSE